MADPRLSTVFDFAALRLRPDGTRVPQQPPVRAAAAVQNTHADWIARDAGGSARVPKLRRRRKAAKIGEEDAGVEEEIDISRELARGPTAEDEGGSASADAPSDGDEDEGPRKKRKARRRAGGPAAKRRRFEADYDYLTPQPPHVRSASAEGSAPPQTQASDNGMLAEPSPDLLKCIHRFASEFYSERGQLLNVTRQYRAERKQARLARQQRKANRSKGKGKATDSNTSKSSTPSKDEEGSDDSSESDEDEGEGDSEVGKNDGSKKEGKRKEREENDEDEDSGDESDEDEGEADEPGTAEAETSKQQPKGKRRRKSGKPKILPPLVTDMYKVFEGSALMVLGMLVQEHVNFLLTPNIPDGWEDEVRRAYTDNLAPDEEDDFDEEDEIMGDESGQGEVPEGLYEDLEEDEEEEEEDGEVAEKNEKDNNSAEEDGEDNTGENEDEEEDEEDPDRDEDEESGDTEDHDGHAVKINTSRIHEQAAETTDVPMELEESDGDSSFKGTSDESMRSDDTVHSDAEDEFS